MRKAQISMRNGRPAYEEAPPRLRQSHIERPLQGLEPPPGELPLWAGVALMFGMGIIGTLLCAAIGG